MPELLSPPLLQTKANLNHLPLSQPRGAYYRSKIISAQSGINPLLTAAAGLIVLMTKIQQPSFCLETHHLYPELIHEIKVFETQAQNLGYRTEWVLIARYILCTTLDEFLLTLAWEQNNQWDKHKLLSVFHGEEWGGERFFIILDRLIADPATHIDLLELIYLCLSQGFAGKYQRGENGKIQLDEIMEKLYECIHWHRGHSKKTTPMPETTINTTVTTVTRHLPLWVIITIACIFLVGLYTVFNFMLASNLAPLYQQLNSIAENYADG